jgi:hypothetical protein
MMTVLIEVVLACAAIPAVLFLWNIWLYKRPPVSGSGIVESVSVLIPARNEERLIGSAVRAALASKQVDVEVIVLDDGSEDGTAAIVTALAKQDPRVRLHPGLPLPSGWCGKQYACHVLSQIATKPLLCFIDADVRLRPSGLARMIAALRQQNTALMSGFPWQETRTIAEDMLLPLMHFLLLGFLPMLGMRKAKHPAFGAGCGQIFVADRAAYNACNGHAAIKDSRHDGITLPRAFRRAGFHTDMRDATEIASCRMYEGAEAVYRGLLKNATEGLAAPGRIVPFSVLLLIGQVLPLPVLVACCLKPAWHRHLISAAAACLLSYVPRLISAVRYRQSTIGAILHPFSILALLAIQWIALLRSFAGVPNTWKGRTYPRTAV